MQAVALQQRPCRLVQGRLSSGRSLQAAATAGRQPQTTRCAASTGRQGGDEQSGPLPGASLVSGTLGLLAAAALATGAATSPQVRPCLLCPPCSMLRARIKLLHGGSSAADCPAGSTWQPRPWSSLFARQRPPDSLASVLPSSRRVLLWPRPWQQCRPPWPKAAPWGRCWVLAQVRSPRPWPLWLRRSGPRRRSVPGWSSCAARWPSCRSCSSWSCRCCSRR